MFVWEKNSGARRVGRPKHLGTARAIRPGNIKLFSGQDDVRSRRSAYRWDVPARADHVAVGEKRATDLPPVAEAADPPTCSKAQVDGGQGRSVMRRVGLDLGARHIAYCEVVDGVVMARATARRLGELEARLGRSTSPARVAFEACREGWHVHDVLRSWEKEPVMLDTTRVRQIGVGRHGRKNDALDAEAMARRSTRVACRWRTCCHPSGARYEPS